MGFSIYNIIGFDRQILKFFPLFSMETRILHGMEIFEQLLQEEMLFN